MTAPRLPNLFKVPELRRRSSSRSMPGRVPHRGAHRDPGVNVQALADFLRNQGQGTLFSLYDLFAGGASAGDGVRVGDHAVHLGQHRLPAGRAGVPVVEKMQRDEEGRKKLTQWTRYLTVVLCLFQAYGYALFTEQIPARWPVRDSSSA